MAVKRSRRVATGFLQNFQEFALEENVIDLAVGVIISTGFGKIVTSFLENMLMPLINPLLAVTPKRLAGVDNFSRAKIGEFLGTVLDFLIIALALNKSDSSDRSI